MKYRFRRPKPTGSPVVIDIKTPGRRFPPDAKHLVRLASGRASCDAD